jgi:tetratricopeptide (TPR) repeat protein
LDLLLVKIKNYLNSYCLKSFPKTGFWDNKFTENQLFPELGNLRRLIMTYRKILLFALSLLLCRAASAQLGVDYDLSSQKPKRFENRVLASEKSNDGKKFKNSRRFIQNTITHYNFYFNANEKLNKVIAAAKAQNRDDYTRLLPFYNYSLDATASQKRELDSVIFKCTTGILIHDTRNDWIDNLYFLIGKSYYLKKDFDSAYITFQFLNYAFAPKEKDGYDIPIGSNANQEEGGNANKVATLEKRNLLQRTFSTPPSRNDGLLWKIRTYIAKDQFAESSSLIEILVHDPQFPARLQPQLQEVRALWFYRQNIYDSAAYYLERALPAAGTKEEQARWEYLIGQLYERAGNSFQSKTFYERTVGHTYNPILEVYARLNAIRQNKEGEGDQDFISKNIDALVKMGKKDRYEPYRDIIYYTAAQMELERNNKAGAEHFLVLCVKSSTGGYVGTQRNKAFLLLGNLSFEVKHFRAAKNYYDSLNMSDPNSLAAFGDLSWLPDRKAALAGIVAQQSIIDRQDSLQRIAALPPDQRDALIKKLVRQLRRQQGLHDEDQGDNFGGPSLSKNNANVPDLFGSNAGGAWYFDNATLKAKGYSDFKNKWGNRPNVDNWELSSRIKQQSVLAPGQRPTPGAVDISGKPIPATGAGSNVIDYKSLLNNLPLTPEKMQKSRDSVEKAMVALGKYYQDGIFDYASALDEYDSVLVKFPVTAYREEVLFNKYYCYLKLGDSAGANRMLEQLKHNFPNGRYTARAANPDSVAEASTRVKVGATRQYEKVYTAFIEGRFDEALAEKKIADSLYGEKYWTPQLLYIQAVYFIRSRQDVQAKVVLNSIMSKFPKTPMAIKASTMLDVLNRRAQIEDYLTKLKVQRLPEDSVVIEQARSNPDSNRRVGTPMVRNDSNMLVRKGDTMQLARSQVHLPGQPTGQQPSAGITGPAKLTIDAAALNKIRMDSGQLARLKKQQDSLALAMQRAAADSQKMASLRHTADSVKEVVRQLQVDSARVAAHIASLNSVFSHAPEKPHSVVIVMNKVDPVYVNETRNAFNGYNLENYYGNGLTIENSSLNDSIKFVTIGTFENADAALAYMNKAKALAPRQIVPWLPAGKYYFMIISPPNLTILLSNKDMAGYRKFLFTEYPDQFRTLQSGGF